MAVRRKKVLEHQLIAAHTELPSALHTQVNHYLSSHFIGEA
jgi:hypothetical protein